MTRHFSVPVGGQAAAQFIVVIFWVAWLLDASFGDAAGRLGALVLYTVVVATPGLLIGVAYGVAWATERFVPHILVSGLLVIFVLAWILPWGSFTAGGADFFDGASSPVALLEALFLMEAALLVQLLTALAVRSALVSGRRRSRGRRVR